MKGVIKSFLPEKGYGFIRGDDGKDYFFHQNALKDATQAKNLCDEQVVEFDQQATPKGYRANQLVLVNPAEVTTYVVPDHFLTSKTDRINGWEIIEGGQWRAHGTSRDSPDAARVDLDQKIKQLGANALINLTYYKKTGSEPGTGRGIHHYTIHNFHAVPVTVAKKNSLGKFSINDLKGIHQRAEQLKAELKKKTDASFRNAVVVWIITLFLCVAMLAGGGDNESSRSGFIPLIVAIVGIWLGVAINTNHDAWLERSES